MIHFEETLRLVLSNAPILPITEKNNYEINSDILAQDIRAREDLPLFSNSAMDGFALRSEDTHSVPVDLKIKGCIKAGDSPGIKVGEGEAVKIMTGAPMPAGADAVVMVEDTEEKERNVQIKKSIKKGENVRIKGEEIKKGQIGLKKGIRLNPASLGFLASMGYEKVKVFGKPKVSVLITGSELVKPGLKLMPGKKWESNSVVLSSVLAEVNIKPILLGITRDNLLDLERQIQEGLKNSDILLISGGISVGDYDFVQEILLRLGVDKVFWRVAIKPGKPTFFGKKGDKLVFGLPGNPVSVLVTFLEFVRPAILKMMGKRDVLLQEREAILEEKLQKKTDRAYFFKGMFQEKNGVAYVKSAGRQHSHILESFTGANCLIFLEKEKNIYEKGERIKIQILPWK
ncbi:MAG TPA: molybdopterin molybdenumtransferase MoeA [Candidatus Aminicenantes bacterium]|nr:molybdopterin molybdenumtransferase MoeA [Candidatus Aminicenantes bacterium]